MRDCYDICLILSEFKDGKLLVRGNFEYLIMVGFFCFKGVFLLKWFYLFDRLKVFLICIGERGSGEFREVSWDEVINFVVNKFKEMIEEYGSESVFVY